MTGEKNRYKTSEQLWKFADETLTTPAHDELVCMLLDPEYAKKLVDYVLIKRKGFDYSLITDTISLGYDTLNIPREPYIYPRIFECFDVCETYYRDTLSKLRHAIR